MFHCIYLLNFNSIIKYVILNINFLLIFNVFRNQNEISVNVIGGHLLRSKESFRDETGVAAGFGALDSPLLT